MIIIEQMFKIIISLFVSFYFLQNTFAKTLQIEGLTKLQSDDIQSITSENIYRNDISIEDLNIILKDLLVSDLIYEVDYIELEKEFY